MTLPADTGVVPITPPTDGPSALRWWLSDAPGIDALRAPNGTPRGCSACPFGEAIADTLSVQGGTADQHDFSCGMLDLEVWGEHPRCTAVQWRRRARDEVRAFVRRTMVLEART